MTNKTQILTIILAILIIIPVTQVSAFEVYHNLSESEVYSGMFEIQVSSNIPYINFQFLAIILDGEVLIQTNEYTYINFIWNTTLVPNGSHRFNINCFPDVGDPIRIQIDVIVEQQPTTITTTTPITTTTTTDPTTPTVTTLITDIITTTTSNDTPFELPIGLVIIGALVGSTIITMYIFRKPKDKTIPIIQSRETTKVLIICRYCGSKTEQGITNCHKCGAEL